MSIQHEKNKQVTQDQVNQLLTHETRVATNMEKVKTGYDANYYSMEQTKEDRHLIDNLLKQPESATLKLSDEQKYRLNAIQGRNISHILLNQNSFTGDSKEMKDAKKYVQALEKLMSQPLQKDTMNQSIADLETAYLEAIAACKYYCDHKDPSFESGRDRKQAVADVLERLRAESAQLSEAKRLFESGQLTENVTSVQDLLVAAQKSLAVNEPAQQSDRQEKTGLAALTFDTFARMVGTHNRGQVELDGNGLKIINNGKFSLSNGVASVENRELRERFLVIVMQQLGEKYAPAMHERIRKMLGLDQAADRMLPLSRQQIRDVVALVNDQISMVDKVLREGKEASMTEHRFALEVDQMIGGQVEDYDRSRATSVQQKILKKEIQTILDQAKKDGMDVPELTKHQMDNLVKGNISRLRDNIFRAINMTYRVMCNLNGGKKKDFAAFAGNRTVFNKIAAYTILQMTAGTESGQVVAAQNLSLFMEDTAFELSGKQELAKDFTQIHIGNLAVRGANGLEGAVEDLLPKNKTWQKDTHKVKRGLDGLTKLCNALQQIERYEGIALSEGLTDDEAQKLQELGDQVVELLSGESQQDISFVAKELKDTRFSVGFNQANALAVVDGQSALLTSINNIITATKNTQKGKQIDNKQKDPQVQERWSSSKEALAYLDVLSDRSRAVAKVILLEAAPSSLLKKDTNKETVDSILALRNTLRDFPEATEYGENVNVAGVNVRLEQSKGGLLRLKLEGQTIPVPFDIQNLIHRLDMEMIEGKKEEGKTGLDIYGEEYARQIFNSLDPESTDDAQIRHVRNVCLKLIEVKMGMRSAAFDTTSTKDLYTLTQAVLDGNVTKTILEKTIEDIQKTNQNLINDVETLELMKKAQLKLSNVKDKVKLAPEKVKETNELQWTPQEKQIQEMIADLIYSKETWKSDEMMNTPKDRIRKTLLNHTDAIMTLIFEPQVLESLFDKLHLNQAGGEETDLKSEIKNTLDTLLNSEELKLLKENKLMGKVIFRKVFPLLLGDNEEDLEKEYNKTIKNMISLTFTAKNLFGDEEKSSVPKTEQQKLEERKKKKEETLQEILNQLKDARKQIMDQLPQVEEGINDIVKDNMKSFQDMINEQVKEVFHSDEKKKEAKTLDEMLEQATSGEKGMALFMKNVLTGYFVSVSDMDKRSMVASALRSVKPQQPLHKLHELKPLKKAKELVKIPDELINIPDDLSEEEKKNRVETRQMAEEENAKLIKENEQIAKENEEIEAENQKIREKNIPLEQQNQQILQDLENNKEKIMGNFLGGFLKGAGPLLQKMLQGMPVKSMPKVLRDALDDMKSNLAPISPEIVQARLLAIVNGSNGKITQIEVVKAMGAASVGQAFLCKLYGPNLPKEGKDVVIKLLRPDVRNRMMREKAFMKKAAAATDKGMEATYLGQLEKIEEELDLRLEAEHVEQGNVYNDGVKTVQTMKVEQLVAPTANTLVLEKAPGTTLDSYLKDSAKELKKIKKTFEVLDKNGNKKMQLTDDNIGQYLEQREKLVNMLNQMKKRQVYLAQLTAKWVNEGIFGREEGGFYHGDLHAGNIMISDDQLTVIDFGNAVKLSSEQQKSIIRMMMAASAGEADDYMHEYHKLLSKDSEDKYQKTRDALRAEFNRIFKLGGADSIGKRIAVSLMKAQELGLELPSEVANFSNCQLRLQNAMDDMNKQIEGIETVLGDLESCVPMEMYLDCTKEYYYDAGTAANEEKRIEAANKYLDKLEMNRNEVQAAVRGKTKKERSDFDQKMNIPEIKQGILENIDLFQSCVKEDGQTKEERLKIFNDKKEAILKNIEKFAPMYDTEEMTRFYQIIDETKECLEHPFENTEKFMLLSQELLECKNMNTYEERLKKLRKAQDDDTTPEEERERLENEFLEMHEKLFNLAVLRKGHIYTMWKATVSSVDDDMSQRMRSEMKVFFADEAHHGKELKEAFEQMETAKEKYKAEINTHIKKLRDLLDQAAKTGDNQEEALLAVRGKSEEERKKFNHRMPLSQDYNDLKQAKQDLLQLANEPESEEKKKKLTGYVNHMLTVNINMVNSCNPEDKDKLVASRTELEQFTVKNKDPKSIEEYIQICDKLLAHDKVMSTYDEALTKLRQAQDDDKIPPEELDRLEKEFMQIYQNTYQIQKSILVQRKKESMTQDVHTLNTSRLLSGLSDIIKIDPHGNEMTEECNKMKQLQDDAKEDVEIKVKIDKFGEIYRQVASERLHDILNSLKKKVNRTDPADFFEVMADVLTSKVKEVGFKVGLGFALRYFFKMQG